MRHNTFISSDGRKLFRGDIGWFSRKEIAKKYGWTEPEIVLGREINKPKQPVQPKLTGQLGLFIIE